MQKIHLVRGRLVGPTTVELDEPVVSQPQNAEVWLRIDQPMLGTDANVFEFLKGLAPGTATKSEIDARIRAERDEWDGR